MAALEEGLGEKRAICAVTWQDEHRGLGNLADLEGGLLRLQLGMEGLHPVERVLAAPAALSMSWICVPK